MYLRSITSLCFCIAVLAISFSCNKYKYPVKPVIPPIEDSTPSIIYHPLKTEQDLDPLMNEIEEAKIVLLGESTHGTHEFYKWRTTITKRLILEKGFDFIAIEGDWVDTYKVNEFITGQAKDKQAAVEILKQYDRWPSSMWGNYEMAEIVHWLNQQNQQKPAEQKIGLYGLDVYSFWEWTYQRSLLKDPILDKHINKLREAFDTFRNDALKYAAAVKAINLNHGKIPQDLWNYVLKINRRDYGKEEFFLLQQYAMLALQGERYFRTMVKNTVESWNIRENYMTATIQRLLEFYGNNTKAIIWAHNGHAGDASYSQMNSSGHASVGQLLKRQEYSIFSVGFGTNKGKVLAGYFWNADLREIPVPPAKAGSWENILHTFSPEDKLILSSEIKNNTVMNKWLPFRSIGAAYSNNAIYGTAIVPKRFDALIYIDSTTPIKPIVR